MGNISVHAIKDRPRSVSKKDVQTFLRVVGYYRKFVPEFTHHSKGLAVATSKAAPNIVLWMDQLLEEFDYLRYALCKSASLSIPNPHDYFILYTDVLGIAIAGERRES